MFFSTVLSFGVLLAPLAQAAVYDVTVGGPTGQLTFSPEAISAQPGDQVVFHFQQKNHTATQSSFASPCGPKDGGFSSGFMPVAANVTDNFPTFAITVNDTQPLWVYCAQAAGTASSHCGQGMVFAVNCGADGSNNSFTDFKNAALAVGQSLQASSSSAGGYGYGTAAPAATGTPTPSTTGGASGAIHTVVVGASGALTYSPSELTAQPGDTVVFQFQAKNHTITQSSFAAPCRKLASTSTTGQVGFDSGFMPVAANSSDFPTYSIVVNDTTPIWAYCRQTGHCGSGMVFAINANDSTGSTKSFTDFVNNAKTLNGTGSSSTPAPAGAASGASRSSVSSVAFGIGLLGSAFLFLL